MPVDFDGGSWKQDANAYRDAARQFGIEVAVEISRSGKGAHGWIFFGEPILAKHARLLGTIILTRASAIRQTLSLSSFDRFFPNQDSLPNGGFGNLIALPLQKNSRDNGTTVFIDANEKVIDDQWTFLASIQKVSNHQINQILERCRIQEVDTQTMVSMDGADILQAQRAIESPSNINGSLADKHVLIRINNRITVDIREIPPVVVAALKQSAIFANPKFFELQRLRFSTYQTPRYIFCGAIDENSLYLPRGLYEQCLDILRAAGASVQCEDLRPRHPTLDLSFELSFKGKLRKPQQAAIQDCLKYDLGVLAAPPGAGKTIMACSLIATRNVPTLILVHRSQLLEQWIDRIEEFLGLARKEIGILKSGRKPKLLGKLDVAMLQSLGRYKNIADLTDRYEQIIVDECHHIPAFSFENVLQKFAARHVLGLTATPYRKDGHQPIIHMQCGAVRHEVKAATTETLSKRVMVRPTSLRLPDELGIQPRIHEVWDFLISDSSRLELIAIDLIQCLQEGRFPLVLSDRKEHLNKIRETVDSLNRNLKINPIVLHGGMGVKARKQAMKTIRENSNSDEIVYVLSTGSLIGEGFDVPELDTLFLCMPVSFKGRVVQYAGRIERDAKGKSDALIYDYFDNCSGLTISMFKKRLTAYNKMRYEIDGYNSGNGASLSQRNLFA